jgi:YfiH family protein
VTGPAAAGVETRRERLREGGVFPVLANARWEELHPGLAAGVTAASGGDDGPDPDFGLTTAGTAWELSGRFEALGRQLGFPSVAVARQVHGDAVTCLEPTPEPGLRVPGESDGLLTSGAGLLLAVTAADCVPVYALDPASGGLALLHAGWRGTAAGVLASGLRAMGARFGTDPAEVRLHLGPAICGDCYEVGPEVVEALGGPSGGEGRAGPDGRITVDLRTELVARARDLGVPPGRISRSGWCTRCGPDHFHSHRGKGDEAGRMAAYLGWRQSAGG